MIFCGVKCQVFVFLFFKKAIFSCDVIWQAVHSITFCFFFFFNTSDLSRRCSTLPLLVINWCCKFCFLFDVKRFLFLSLKSDVPVNVCSVKRQGKKRWNCVADNYQVFYTLLCLFKFASDP